MNQELSILRIKDRIRAIHTQNPLKNFVLTFSLFLFFLAEALK